MGGRGEGGGCYLPWLWLLIDATDSKETRSTVLYLPREGEGGEGEEWEESKRIQDTSRVGECGPGKENLLACNVGSRASKPEWRLWL